MAASDKSVRECEILDVPFGHPKELIVGGRCMVFVEAPISVAGLLLHD